MPKYYLSGLMTGLPGLNYEAFNEAANTLRRMGFEIVNPVDLAVAEPSSSDNYYLRKDIQQLMDSHGVFVLPGWEYSKGSTLEVSNAVRLGMPVLAYPNLQ